MGIMLASTGLPFMTSTGRAAAVPIPDPKPEPEPGEITLNGPTTSISYRGVTFDFSKPVHWYESANGDPVVISHADYLPEGTSITSISPAGALSAGGVKINGAVKNPIEVLDISIGQGFDEGLASTSWSTTMEHAYVDALNIDPANTGSAIPINPGDALTVVKAVRAEGIDDHSGPNIEKYVPLTVMNTLPPGPGTWFRPSISNETKEWPRIPVEQMDLSGGEASPLRNLAAPDGIDSPSFYLDQIEQWDTRTLPLWLPTGEVGRRAQPRKEDGKTSISYARDWGRARALYALALFCDQSSDPAEQSARETLAALLIQWGIDCDGAHQMGQYHSSGAGQNYGYHEFFYLAGFMLGDAAMVERAQWHRSNTMQQTFWVTERNIGYPVRWDWGSSGGSSKKVGETYRNELLGLPEWTIGGWLKVEHIQAETMPETLGGGNASTYAVYRDTHFNTVILEGFPIFLLRNGPDGETGIEAANHNLPAGIDNISSAVLPYIDRSMTFSPARSLNQHTGTARVVYNSWRDEIPQIRWEGQPDIFADHDFPVFSVENAGDGEIIFDASLIYYTTKPITDRQISYSQDGLQFVDPISIGANTAHTLTALRPGTPHWCRWRQINADGEPSAWSQTWEQNLASGSAGKPYTLDRGKVSTAGTPAGALVNEITPAIVYKPYPDHEMPYFEALSDVTSVRFLYAGMGYWSGGAGDLAASFQWQRDTGSGWADIAGATDRMYTRQSADSGNGLRCLVTVVDQAGHSEQLGSNTISVPAAATLPAGTIVDTDFRGEFPYDYPNVWSQMNLNEDDEPTPNNSIKPYLYPDLQIDAGYTKGLLNIRKWGRRPTMVVDLATDVDAGTYEYETHLGGGFFPTGHWDNMESDLRIEIRDGADNMLADLSIPKKSVTSSGYMTKKTGTFVAPAGTIRFYYHSDHNAASDWSGSGGGVLGGPVFSKLTIRKTS